MGSYDNLSKADDAYEVQPTTLFDPANRHVRVIGIGTGFSGLTMAYKIQTQCENVDLQIYEKNESVGGTWFENRYPGCACDVPSHSYVFPWAPNPEWPQIFAGAKDILQYLNDVADCCGLRRYIKLNHRVAGCWWDEEKGKWKVKVEMVEPKEDWSSPEPARVVGHFFDEADILLHAAGILHHWSLPDIPGLASFKGRVVHTAGWPDDYTADAWKGENVVVIGSGASSVQVIPEMQKHVKHMDVFTRSASWFIDIAGHGGHARQYKEPERETFRSNPEALVNHMKDSELLFNSTWDHALVGTKLQKDLVVQSTERMREKFRDDALFEGTLPKFPVFCRRPLAGDPYTEAIQQPNVDVHFTSATRVTEDGVFGEDGTFAKCDTIICATGFDSSWRPQFPIIGRNGVSLAEKWKKIPEAYFGLACPDMPNWLTFMGPNWPIANGSVIGSLDAHGDYAVQCIKKMQGEWLHSFCPKQDVTDEYNEHTQLWVKKSVWGQDCPSWYTDKETGHVKAIYSGHMLHFRDMVSSVRWEHMDIRYSNKRNRFAFMGIGRPAAHLKMGTDISPYFRTDRIDPRWSAAKLNGKT